MKVFVLVVVPVMCLWMAALNVYQVVKGHRFTHRSPRNSDRGALMLAVAEVAVAILVVVVVVTD
ncbi:MAG: hypothetical protein U0W40_02215 [Acidimicrobiia bacterium]